VRLPPGRRTMVVWSSSPGRADRHRVGSARPGRIGWWLRTGALFTIIGVMRLARTAAKYPRPALSLAGIVVTLIGISLPSKAVLISGFLVCLLALFMPSDAALAPARSDAGRLCALPLTPFAPSDQHLPPSD
jgi:hypothetical protein